MDLSGNSEQFLTAVRGVEGEKNRVVRDSELRECQSEGVKVNNVVKRLEESREMQV